MKNSMKQGNQFPAQTVDKGPGLLRGYGLFLMPKIIEIPTFDGILWYNSSIINERNSLF